MATNALIKQAFGNHNFLQQYIESLTNPDTLPPFPPVLYRQFCHGPDDIEIIIINGRECHKQKNIQVKNELIRQFAVYQQLINPNTINGNE